MEFHSTEEIYVQTAKLIPEGIPVHLLDLGCCTELEYDAFIQVNSKIEVTGIDEESHLKKMLERKSGKRIERLRLIYGDYWNADLGKHHYNAVMSIMELGKRSRKDMLVLYKKIYDALDTDGCYIEREWVKEEAETSVNISNLFSKQVALLLETGFQRVEKAWHKDNIILLRAIK